LGIAPFYWDNGWTGMNGSGIFNRDTETVFDQDSVDALTGGSKVPGDFNGDGIVDGRDFLKWQADGLSESELNDWEQNYANQLQSAVSTVPEPSSPILVLSTVLVLSRSTVYRVNT